MNNLKIQKICNYLLYGFVFLIPWQTRYIYKSLTLGGEIFEYGKLSFYLSEVFLILFIICYLIYIKKRKEPKEKISKATSIIFLFLLVIIISFFGALNKQVYFYGLIKLMEVIVLYFLVTKIKFSYLKLRISFVFSMLIHSFLGIYQFFSQSIFANKYLGIAEQVSSQGGVSVLEGVFGRLLRVYGGFSHPNILAGFLVVAILILISIYFDLVKSESLFNRVNKKRKLVLFYSSLVILFSALILTFSRSAFLALFLSLLSLLIYSVFKKTETKKVVSILLILVLVSSLSFVLFNDFLKTRIQGQERLELKSSTERMVLKNQALELLNKNWFLGTGVNNYIVAVYEKVDNTLNVWEYQPVHNVYLLILVELGILGLFLYLYLLIYSLYRAFSSNNLSKLILGLVVLTIIIINFFDHYFWTYWSGLIITFLVIGLINKK
jgi:O-antigen ligase